MPAPPSVASTAPNPASSAAGSADAGADAGASNFFEGPPPEMPPEESALYDAILDSVLGSSCEGQATISRDASVKFLKRSELSSRTLHDIWYMCGSAGPVTRDDLRTALRLVGHAQAGAAPELTLCLVPPPRPPRFTAAAEADEWIEIERAAAEEEEEAEAAERAEEERRAAEQAEQEAERAARAAAEHPAAEPAATNLLPHVGNVGATEVLAVAPTAASAAEHKVDVLTAEMEDLRAAQQAERSGDLRSLLELMMSLTEQRQRLHASLRERAAAEDRFLAATQDADFVKEQLARCLHERKGAFGKVELMQSELGFLQRQLADRDAERDLLLTAGGLLGLGSSTNCAAEGAQATAAGPAGGADADGGDAPPGCGALHQGAVASLTERLSAAGAAARAERHDFVASCESYSSSAADLDRKLQSQGADIEKFRFVQEGMQAAELKTAMLRGRLQDLRADRLRIMKERGDVLLCVREEVEKKAVTAGNRSRCNGGWVVDEAPTTWHTFDD